MRPLTLEEITRIRKDLRWWMVPIIASTAFGLVALLTLAVRGAPRGGWGMAVPLVVTLVAFNGGLYYYVMRPLRQDLSAGFAETLSGPVESRWQRKDGILIQVAGRDILVRGMEAPAVGEQVSVDFLPRSKKALKVTKLGSTP